MARFDNDFADHTGFIDLGAYDYSMHGDSDTVRCDLYAIIERDGLTVHFGAKESDEPSDYASGSAYWDMDSHEWHFHISNATAVAAARFFARYDNTPGGLRAYYAHLKEVRDATLTLLTNNR